MPIYEYACNDCGAEFEEVRKMSDDSTPACPKCGKPNTKKMISASAFQLKGGGWYKDGYASTSGAAAKTTTPSTSTPSSTAPKADKK